MMRTDVLGAVAMVVSCRGCAHKLWAEVRETGGIRFTLYFDDDEKSDTYAEHVMRCPNCGLSLIDNSIESKEHSRLPK